jgi:hypothetical protein
MDIDYKLPAADEHREKSMMLLKRQSVQKQLSQSVRAPQTLGSL